MRTPATTTASWSTTSGSPSQPEVVAQVVCPGSQNDVSVWKDLLVLSVDSSRSDDSCQSTTQSATEKESWEGVRVFDISDPANPQYIAAVETPCGSHTHTLAPDQSGRNLYVYVSSYSPNATFPDCQPPHDAISIVKIPRSAPEGAFLASTPVLFPDGGNPGGNGSSTTSGCHDITAYPSRDIAAGACMGDGVLIDISDRENPVVTEQVRDTDELRVLALRDLQQQRPQGRLHRRARRRRRPDLQQRRSVPTRAPTASTTSSAASSSSAATTRCPASSPTPRTAWPTTAR